MRTALPATGSLWLVALLVLQGHALQPPHTATRRTAPLAAHRHFVVAASNASSAVANGQFSVNNLLQGRVDVLCRCATSALWYSNGIRTDASLHLSLNDTTASVAGAEVRGLAPDEKTFALQLQRALEDDGKAAAAQEGFELREARRRLFAQKSPRNLARRVARAAAKRPPFPAGFEIRRGESLAELVRRLSNNTNVVVLDEGGAPFEPTGGDVVVVVADQLGWAPGALEGLVAAGARACSLGDRPLLASQCLTLVNHRLDERDEAKKRTRRFKAQKRAERTFSSDGDLLKRLLAKGDPWDATDFSGPHRAFKASHNAVLARFARRYGAAAFALDGADAASTRALADAGVEVYVANPFPATAAALRRRGAHVVESRAEDYLPTADVAFGAIYLDGCSGAPEPLVECAKYVESGVELPEAFAVGFTLTLAEPEGREIADREQTVVRAWSAAAGKRGYACRRPFDDESDPPPRSSDGILTTWLVFER